MKIGKWTISIFKDEIDTDKLVKDARDKALQECIDVCKSWRPGVEKSHAEASLKGNFTYAGQLNLIDLCVQRIEEKITGKRKWS
jgi:hypothetical protein